MNTAFIILICMGAAVTADTSKWVDFRVKFSPLSTGVGLNSFWPVEKTLEAALVAGWVHVDTNNTLGATTLCLTSDDVRVCPLYDAKGFFAGLQMAIPPADVEGENPYDFNRQPVYEKKRINGVLYWTSSFYLVDPVTIAAGGRSSAPTFGDGLWIKNGTEYWQVPVDEKSINQTTPYTWQNCIPNMGIHYYYNATPALDCNEFYPFFMLIKEGNLIGLGWQVLGKTQFVTRNWYESINGQAVQTAVPLGPKCLSERADLYGVISTHVYFVDKPWTITCDQETESVVPIPGLP